MQAKESKQMKVENYKAPLRLKKGVHYGTYGVQYCDTLRLDPIPGRDAFLFYVIDGKEYEPFEIDPTTDLSALSQHILEQLDEQMYMAGECDEDEARQWAKYSETRKHIKSYRK